MVAARRIIQQGCEQCPKNEDIWFHAAELNVSHQFRLKGTGRMLIEGAVDTGKCQGYTGQGCSAFAAVRQDLAEGFRFGD